MKYLTEIRKTVETGVDPRLQIVLKLPFLSRVFRACV